MGIPHGRRLIEVPGRKCRCRPTEAATEYRQISRRPKPYGDRTCQYRRDVMGLFIHVFAPKLSPGAIELSSDKVMIAALIVAARQWLSKACR
jgi:hypothetical protein